MRRIKAFLKEDKEYFAFSKDAIMAQNNRMLKNGCLVYAAVLAFYTVITGVAGHSEILLKMYFTFDVIHAALCIGVINHSKQCGKDFKMTQRFCVLLELCVLGFFALEAVYVSQTQHSLYVPIAILLIMLLFIHGALYTIVVTLAYVVSFAVLSCLYKTPEAYTNDIYIAGATLISACIGYVLIAKMRHSTSVALLKYENLSKTDALTGLLNKSAIEALCERIIAESGHVCAFIILDLDDFKSVNDIYGHDVGDEVLRAVGTELKKGFREMDHLGRFGGDEFVVLMDNCKELRIAVERTEKIISGIARLRFSQEKLRVQCSAGITVKTGEDTFISVFKRADKALYEAKANGAGSYRAAEAV